jgi:uncharacterized membrane protein
LRRIAREPERWTDVFADSPATNVVDRDVKTAGGYQSRDVVFGVLAGLVFGAGVMIFAAVRMRRATPAPAEPGAPVAGAAAAHD